MDEYFYNKFRCKELNDSKLIVLNRRKQNNQIYSLNNLQESFKMDTSHNYIIQGINENSHNKRKKTEIDQNYLPSPLIEKKEDLSQLSKKRSKKYSINLASNNKIYTNSNEKNDSSSCKSQKYPIFSSFESKSYNLNLKEKNNINLKNFA